MKSRAITAVIALSLVVASAACTQDAGDSGDSDLTQGGTKTLAKKFDLFDVSVTLRNISTAPETKTVSVSVNATNLKVPCDDAALVNSITRAVKLFQLNISPKGDWIDEVCFDKGKVPMGQEDAQPESSSLTATVASKLGINGALEGSIQLGGTFTLYSNKLTPNKACIALVEDSGFMALESKIEAQIQKKCNPGQPVPPITPPSSGGNEAPGK
jgi:hypothetical protein